MFWGTHGLHCLVCFSPLFSLWSGCMDFSADLAKQRRKNSWGGFEVSKNDFCVYFFFWCVVFFVPIYSLHAVPRHARPPQTTTRHANHHRDTLTVGNTNAANTHGNIHTTTNPTNNVPRYRHLQHPYHHHHDPGTE